MYAAGGIGGLVLAVFHKIESSNFKIKWYKKSTNTVRIQITGSVLDYIYTRSVFCIMIYMYNI